MTRATRHVCGAAPCLGVADVAGSVIGHAGDVACAQTKTFAQRSREQSHTQQLESAPGLDKGSQDRDNTHTGACMRAPPCLQACVSGNPLTHAGFHAVARLGVVVSCGGIRAAHTGGAGKRPVSHAQHASGGSVSPGETNTRKVDPSHGTQAGLVIRGAHRRGSPPHPGRPRHPRHRCRTAGSLRFASMSGVRAAVICHRQRRGVAQRSSGKASAAALPQGRQAYEHREQQPIAKGCAAPRGAPSAGEQACPQRRRSPQPAKRAIRIANIAVWIARNRHLLFPLIKSDCGK